MYKIKFIIILLTEAAALKLNVHLKRGYVSVFSYFEANVQF